MTNLRRLPASLATLLLLMAACEPADDVRVQALPPLERPSPESRAGLPEIAGIWNFAGWELVSARLDATLGSPPSPGRLVVQTQRLDSLAGWFERDEVRLPWVGEVRRDGVVALVDRQAETGGWFAAGRAARDTLRLELGTAPLGVPLGQGIRWLFVRSPTGQPVVRLPGGSLLRDTVVALPEPAPIAEPTVTDTVRPAAPATRPPAATEQPPPAARPPPAEPARRPQPTEPAPRAPPPQADTVPADDPPVEPEVDEAPGR